MGYHISIVNENIYSHESRSILYNIELLTYILEAEFNFIKRESEGEFFFTNSENEDFILFYLDGELWANTTNDELILKMVNIAKFFNDGTIVKGDEGEVYYQDGNGCIQKDLCDSSEEVYFYDNIWLRFKGIIVLLLISIFILIFRYIFRGLGS